MASILAPLSRPRLLGRKDTWSRSELVQLLGGDFDAFPVRRDSKTWQLLVLQNRATLPGNTFATMMAGVWLQGPAIVLRPEERISYAD